MKLNETGKNIKSKLELVLFRALTTARRSIVVRSCSTTAQLSTCVQSWSPDCAVGF